MEFRAGDFATALKESSANGLLKAAIFTANECKAALSVVNPGTRTKYKFKKTKSGRAATHSVYGTPSKPGESPRQRTGTGKGRVAYEFNDDPNNPSVRVGVPASVLYMAMHEAGIHYKQAGLQQRPWLVRTVMKHLATLAQLFMSEKQT